MAISGGRDSFSPAIPPGHLARGIVTGDRGAVSLQRSRGYELRAIARIAVRRLARPVEFVVVLGVTAVRAALATGITRVPGAGARVVFRWVVNLFLTGVDENVLVVPVPALAKRHRSTGAPLGLHSDSNEPARATTGSSHRWCHRGHFAPVTAILFRFRCGDDDALMAAEPAILVSRATDDGSRSVPLDGIGTHENLLPGGHASSGCEVTSCSMPERIGRIPDDARAIDSPDHASGAAGARRNQSVASEFRRDGLATLLLILPVSRDGQRDATAARSARVL
jgi:hypothetical protein